MEGGRLRDVRTIAQPEGPQCAVVLVLWVADVLGLGLGFGVELPELQAVTVSGIATAAATARASILVTKKRTPTPFSASGLDPHAVWRRETSAQQTRQRYPSAYSTER